MLIQTQTFHMNAMRLFQTVALATSFVHTIPYQRLVSLSLPLMCLNSQAYAVVVRAWVSLVQQPLYLKRSRCMSRRRESLCERG